MDINDFEEYVSSICRVKGNTVWYNVRLELYIQSTEEKI
jgi:hypothetical protein